MKEIIGLWIKNVNFSQLSSQSIQAKRNKLINTYDECVKCGNYDSLHNVFDITKGNGSWLCNENNMLYRLQIESKGQIG